MRSTTHTEAAWLAGLFEGEGWVGVNNGSSQMVLQMVDEDIVQRFAALVGTGTVRTVPSKRGHQTLYRWTKGGRPFVEGFLRATRDHLGQRRLQQFEDALANSR
jgi:hypothetical protein